MQGDKDGIIIAEGIHMLNPLIFEKIRGIANGIYVAPRTRIITYDDKIVRPEQLRGGPPAHPGLQHQRPLSAGDRGAGGQRQSGRGELHQAYKSNATIQIDSFHDYEPCILAKYLLEIPQFRQELTDEFMAENDLTDLMKVVREVPPLHTPYVPLNSIVREFVGGSCYEY